MLHRKDLGVDGCSYHSFLAKSCTCTIVSSGSFQNAAFTVPVGTVSARMLAFAIVSGCDPTSRTYHQRKWAGRKAHYKATFALAWRSVNVMRLILRNRLPWKRTFVGAVA